MMIAVDFNILNQKGSPALYQDTFANRPAASLAGRIFLATDTGNLYRDTGVSWTQIATGGGPGTTPGIDDVLAVGQLFTSSRSIDSNQFNFSIQNTNGFDIGVYNSNLGSNLPIFFALDSGGDTIINIGDYNGLEGNIFLQVGTTARLITTIYNGLVSGLLLNLFDGEYTFGSCEFSNKINLNVNDSLQTIYSSYDNFQKGLNLDFINNVFCIGDYDNINTGYVFRLDENAPEMGFYSIALNQYNGLLVYPNYAALGDLTNINSGTSFFVDDNSTLIKSVYNTIENGLLINYTTSGGGPFYKFGDFNFYNGAGAGSIVISGGNAETRFNTQSLNFDDNTTGNLTQGTSGSVSGQHLKVTINGANYVIELKNP